MIDLFVIKYTEPKSFTQGSKMSSDQVPKEAKIASLLLNSSGIQECEPKVVQQIMEFMFSKSL